MSYCHHGSYYWRTDKAGAKCKYCRICDALVHRSQPKPKKVVVKDKPKLEYTGDPNVNAGACVRCGCAVHECECGAIPKLHMNAVLAKLRLE